jgi:hypothetical protein
MNLKLEAIGNNRLRADDEVGPDLYAACGLSGSSLRGPGPESWDLVLVTPRASGVSQCDR